MEKFSLKARVAEEDAGLRLDLIAARLFPDFSRARLQQWIREGALRVDGRTARAKEKLAGREILSLEAEPEAGEDWEGEELPLTVVFEDDALIVVDKPPDSVVHPAAGNRSGTLLNALLFHYPELHRVPRAGIVHRLDKDTSGLMVVARTLVSHRGLVEQIQQRQVTREYSAVVNGLVTAGGKVDAPLGRHPVNRTKQAVVAGGGKEAVTHYNIERRYRAHTLLTVRLETGRTHQIRVHMAHIGYPLTGDPVYGGRPRPPRGAGTALIERLRTFRRQALHAGRLGLCHPDSGENLEFHAQVPGDMRELLQALEQDHDHE